MVPVFVRFFEGTRLRVWLQSLFSIADLRVILDYVRPVAPMHEIKLTQDLRELKDGDQINTELQAVITPSLDKAVAAIEDCMGAIEVIEAIETYMEDTGGPSDEETEDALVRAILDHVCIGLELVAE